jgi:outer membrane lipoprotein-sorting protein
MIRRIFSAMSFSLFTLVACSNLSNAQDSDKARKLFEAMEQNLRKAKGYKVDFESAVMTNLGQGKVKGTLVLAPGNRMKFSFGFFEDNSQPTTAFISDGKLLTILHAGRLTKTEPVNDQFQETLTGWGFRIGLFFATTHINDGVQDDYRTLKLSDFKLAGEEKVEGRQAKLIEFTVTKETIPTRHKLWLDVETGLPLKLVAETTNHFGIREIYRNWELDPKLPDGAFAIPK